MDWDLANSELLSIVGLGATASIGYSLISESARNWFNSKGVVLLESSLSTKILLGTLIFLIIPLSILGRIDVVHSFENNVYVEIDGTPRQLIGDGTKTNQKFIGVVLTPLNLKVGRFFESENYFWLKKIEIDIPFEVSMESNSDLQRIEGQLAYSLFQFYESKYLRNAQSFISAKAEDEGQSRATERLSLLSQILFLSIVGPDVPGSRKNLIHRFKTEFANDGWTSLLEAGDLYADSNYFQAGQIISTLNTYDSTWPGRYAQQFFAAVCFLKSSRSVEEPEKSNRLSMALEGFKKVEAEASTATPSPYKSHVLASAVIFQGIHHHYKGDIVGAKNEFQRATEFAQGSLRARSFNGVGYLEFIQGNLDKAEIALLNALESDPNFAYALSNYGYVLMANNKFSAAINYFDRNAKSEELIANSYRDVLLAQLAIGHAKEELTDSMEEIADYYSETLRSAGRRDFYGLSPVKLRLAYQYNEMAEKVYLSKDYYGLEVFAFALLSKSRANLDELGQDDARVQDLSKKVIDTMERIRPNVPAEWLSDSADRGAFFSWIKKY